MKKSFLFCLLCLLVMLPGSLLAFPTVFPHGTTIYKPDKCFSGFTILTVKGYQTILIDMNGNVVKHWPNVCDEEHPAKMLPNGYVMGATGKRGRLWHHPGSNDLSVVDWDGNIVWTYKKAGVHHDFQREGNPVGYYVPGMEPYLDRGKTLILSHKVVKNRKISDKKLYDD
ncbi:MAG: transcriptional initiation protein Tat, partial [Deltaproteobacteria bacterium]|nr:transcriptional initiation protein Tat [Deltaproteobacteria bacterium]